MTFTDLLSLEVHVMGYGPTVGLECKILLLDCVDNLVVIN